MSEGTRLYTRTGDKGTTFCVAAGGRVSKGSQLIELVGSIDEASSSLGYAASLCEERGCPEEITDLLRKSQRIVFRVGFAVSGRNLFKGDEVEMFERQSDRLMRGIKLEGFTLPGTTLESSAIHVARTAVRRAERRLVAALDSGLLERNEAIEYALRVLNRMSDALFAAATRIEADRGKLTYV